MILSRISIQRPILATMMNLVIVLFGIYWVVQTKELWKGTDRASVQRLRGQ